MLKCTEPKKWKKIPIYGEHEKQEEFLRHAKECPYHNALSPDRCTGDWVGSRLKNMTPKDKEAFWKHKETCPYHGGIEVHTEVIGAHHHEMTQVLLQQNQL